MGAQGGHPAAVQHQDAVGLHQGGDPVGDQQHGGAVQSVPQSGANFGVGLGIHGGQGVVKHHNGRLLHQHPGNGHSLLLSAGQGHAPLAHHGVVPLGEGGDGLVHAGDGGGTAHGLVFRVRPHGADILAHGLGKQERLLEHQADPAAQGLPLHVPDVHPADGDGAAVLRQVIEPVQQMDQGALAGAGAPQNGKGLALADGKGHVPQHRLALIAEGNVVKDDVAVHGVHGVGLVLLLPGIQDVAHPVHGHPGLAHVRQHPAQGPDRPGQGLVIGDEGHEGAQGHPPGYAFAGPGHHDDHHLQTRQQGAGGPVYGQQLSQPDPELGETLVLGVEFLLLVPLPAEGPDHADGGKVLLGAGGQVALRLVGGLEPAGDLPVEHPGGQAHNGDEQRRDQRQPQVHGEHDAQVQRDEKHRAHHLHQLIAHELADHVHVGGAALDDVAGGVIFVPGKGQILDVAVQVVPDTLDIALGAPGQLEPLAVAANAPQQGRQQYAACCPP